MDGGSEGTSAKYENGGREWFSGATMTFDVGVSVWFVILFYGMYRRQIKRGRNSGCKCAYIENWAIREAVGTRRINSFYKNKKTVKLTSQF